ncbi:trimeric LpxA-like protein [Neohortaea acidophila]|uniref:Dynactin subunit 5 n=1 Tax=Neohortaea acidophila TaxID=245834 RepID=A0A6A6PW24_9PEZI|nr:trimeric LpxA-like protein [Neohortaea acidophila]KAF2483941.1 trimeric LpxA-like protein [Neohortaea acidophila]
MSRSAPASRRTAKTEYIETDTGNKISRRAHIEGKQNIMLGGKTVIMSGVHLRGDLCRKPEPAADGEKEKTSVTAISIGRSTIIATNSIIRPPNRLHKGQMTYIPMRIGDNVFIGPNCHISSASISNHVHVGANSVLSSLCIIKEGSKVLPGTVVPPNMTIPAGRRWWGG